jgi:hypothetical protein
MGPLDNPAIRSENIRALRRRGFSEADAVRQAVSPSAGAPLPKDEEMGEMAPDDEGRELDPKLMGGNTGITGGMKFGPPVDQSAGMMKPLPRMGPPPVLPPPGMGPGVPPPPPTPPPPGMGPGMPPPSGMIAGPGAPPPPGPPGMEQALLQRTMRPAVQPARRIIG